MHQRREVTLLPLEKNPPRQMPRLLVNHDLTLYELVYVRMVFAAGSLRQ
jgi:hypothetical protein